MAKPKRQGLGKGLGALINLTPDGEAIVFCGRADIKLSRDLYRAQRDGDGWGEPVKLFPGMYATSTLDGALYYTTRGEGRDYGAIVRRNWNGTSYGEPELVAGEGINTEWPDAHPWISPVEDLLVFDTYRTGQSLALAGIRMRHPEAAEGDLWQLWAKQHLGCELFETVYEGPDG